VTSSTAEGQSQAAEPRIQVLRQRVHQLVGTVHTTQRRCDELSLQGAASRSQQQALAASQQELTSQRDSLQVERVALQAERDALLSQLETLSAQRDRLQQERDQLSTERAALTSSQQELGSQRDGLQAERDALQAERDAFNAQLQELSGQCQEHTRKRQELSNQIESLRSQRNDFQVERDQALGKTDSLQLRISDLTSALRHIFPAKMYRDIRPDISALVDEELLNHFVTNGINESIAHVISGNAMGSAIKSAHDKISLLEANQKLLLKERDDLAFGLAVPTNTTTGQTPKEATRNHEGLKDKISGESLLSIHLNDLTLASDKWESYFGHYERNLSPYRSRSDEVALLEVGVQNGGSLEAWKKFLGEKARIVGTDINPVTGLLNLPDLVSSFVGDATDSEWARRLCEAKGPFDIIIDDGSHKNADIIKTFSLFFSSVKPGGLYICEDLHTAYWQKFGGALPGAGATAVEMFKEIVDLVNIEHWSKLTVNPSSQYTPLLSAAIGKAECLMLSDLIAIESIEFCNSLVLIRKKQSGPCSLGRRIVGRGNAAVDPSVFDVDGTRSAGMGFDND